VFTNTRPGRRETIAGVRLAFDAVLFDLDDTLFDHTGSATAAVHGWVTELGLTPSQDLIARWFAIERVHFDAWLAGEVSHSEQRRRRLREFLPLLGLVPPDEDAGLDASFATFLGFYQRSWRAFDDARPALELARSNELRIGVLTNGSTRQQNAKLAGIGLADLVEVVRTAEDLGVGKPAAEAFRITCSALGADPARTLMVGDNPDVDVAAARLAGLSALHLDRAAGHDLRELLATALRPENLVP
jgi:putative hydrolase of the HAD superfamily